MNLKELKELLSKLSPEFDECQIILQKDAEGNGYSPLMGVDESCIYEPDNAWSGTVMKIKWTAYEACMDKDEWEEYKKEHKQAIVLYPVN
jgi:hypothetical protein